MIDIDALDGIFFRLVNNSFFFSASAKSYLFNYLTSESNPTSMLLRIGKNDLIARGVAHIAWQVLLEISKHLKGRLGPRVSNVTFFNHGGRLGPHVNFTREVDGKKS